MKEQDADEEDNVVVQGESEKQMLFAEHTYKTAYKLKSQKLLQLVQGQGWKQILDIKDLYMAKIAYNPDCTHVYVIGGAKDQRSKQTVNQM